MVGAALMAGGCGGDEPDPAEPADSRDGRATVVTDEKFQDVVLEADGLVIVFFTAPWSGPDRVIAPSVDEIAAERTDVRIVKLNVDENPRTAARYEILSIPTLLFFRDGKVAGQIVGAVPKKRIEDKIDAALR